MDEWAGSEGGELGCQPPLGPSPWENMKQSLFWLSEIRLGVGWTASDGFLVSYERELSRLDGGSVGSGWRVTQQIRLLISVCLLNIPEHSWRFGCRFWRLVRLQTSEQWF